MSVAQALLASAVLGDGELDALVEFGCGVGVGIGVGIGVKKRVGGGGKRLGLGVKSLDDALDGGLSSGSIVSVSGEGTGAGEVSISI
jgi:hypothetical protein